MSDEKLFLLNDKQLQQLISIKDNKPRMLGLKGATKEQIETTKETLVNLHFDVEHITTCPRSNTPLSFNGVLSISKIIDTETE